MTLLFILLIPAYALIFHVFVLKEYYFIPLDILIAVILSALSIVLVFLIAVPIIKLQKKDNWLKHKFYRSWDHLFMLFTKVSYEVEGKENIPDGPFLICPNHKSYFDILIIYAAINRKITFISKRENFKIPIVSEYMKAIGCISIDRDNDREAVKGILEGVKVLKSGMPIVIFPEGGIRSRTDEHMLDLKAGAYKLATKAKCPILPVTLVGLTKIKHNIPWKRSRVKAIIHKPITPEDYEGLSTHEIGEKVIEIVNSRVE